MKITKLLFVIVALTFLQQSITTAQESIGINFFDITNSGAGAVTCWDNYKSYVYLNGGATFTRCSTNYVPVNTASGSRAMAFTTTNLNPYGYWYVEFKYDWGHSINFLRYGATPLLHLRLKWGAIASGAETYIYLHDDQSIKSLYNSYNGTGATYSNQNAYVTLSDYVTPSTTTWQDVYIPMSDFLLNNPNLDLTRIGVLEIAGNGTYSSTNTMYIEKMRIVPSIASQYSDMIKVNQIGYLPDSKKLAIVSYESGAVASPPTYFQVRNASTGDIVFTSYNLPLKTAADDHSGDIVRHADFTSFTTPGRYVVCCPEIGQTSVAFDIRSDVFDEVFRDSLRFFYYARSGQEINEPYAEGHTRPAIYTNNSASVYDYDDNDGAKMYDYDPGDIGITTRDVRGGWFDAGDLHLDIHNNITPMWFLLEMLEQYKDKFGPNVLNLPESDSQTNDLVLLIKYQLEWFKKMQNTDGSVHFIVYAHSSPVNHQHVSDVSTGAACVLAGVFAKAYTQFSTIPGYETYAADLLDRAELSWDWLMVHTSTYDPESPGIGHWSYGITNDIGHRAFAAIELYLATGESEYRNYFENGFNAATGDKALNAFGGNSYYGYIASIDGSALSKGYMDYAEETVQPVTASIKTAIRNSFTTAANQLRSRANTGAGTYRVPTLMFNDLYWGSSGLICGNGYVLLRVYEWTGTTTYREAAIDSLEWVCGRNPVSRIFITGDYSDYLHGTDHYSFYMFDHLNPVPGYLCGNINMLNDYWLSPYIKYSWKYYLNIQNASLLEPCLHWQAEMCYLLSYFAADLKVLGDIHLDGVVNNLDLLEFSQAWLSSSSDANWNARCELASPANNIIDFADFAVLAGNWYKTGW